MNTFIIITAFFLTTATGITTLTCMPTNKNITAATKQANSNPYNISFSLKKEQKTSYLLIINMQLAEGAYYVSPNSRRDFKGKFKLYIDSKTHLGLDRFLIEQPASTEVYDKNAFVDGYVNWVTENTQYSKQIQVLTNNDFIVHGYVQFTIEPRCTLEKIPFILKQQNGKLVVELDVC